MAAHQAPLNLQKYFIIKFGDLKKKEITELLLLGLSSFKFSNVFLSKLHLLEMRELSELAPDLPELSLRCWKVPECPPCL